MALHDIDLDRPEPFDLTLLKDDKEEDLVGSDLHQLAIRTLFEGLWLAGPHRGLPWHVSTQLVVVMHRIPGRARRWRPSPDIFVHPTAGHDLRTSLIADAEGVPPLMIEVASPTTWTNDLRDKRAGYEHVGVQEYLIFDPGAELLGTLVRAWHATPRGYEPWLPDASGRWHSAVLGVSFEYISPLLRVRDQAGALMPTFVEQARRIAEMEAELRRLREEKGDA